MVLSLKIKLILLILNIFYLFLNVLRPQYPITISFRINGNDMNFIVNRFRT